MEQKLKKLFDYQRFERNERLEKLIREAEGCCAEELSDDSLFLVNAAGEPAADPRREKVPGGGDSFPDRERTVPLYVEIGDEWDPDSKK